MNARIFLLLIFTVLFGLFAICVQSGTPTPFTPDNPASYHYGERFTLTLGETVMVEEERFQITLDALLEDSRCPANAECFWAGQAKVQLNVNGEQVILTLGDLMEGDTASLDLEGGIVLELLDIQPHPGSKGDVEEAAQTAELVVSKG
ncbi:MAG: hypothetical protein PVI99_05015 [Anaerolineales bacterium]|jgi:hypothetical protein